MQTAVCSAEGFTTHQYSVAACEEKSAWRIQKVRIRTFWEAALYRWRTLQPSRSVSSSPVQAALYRWRTLQPSLSVSSSPVQAPRTFETARTTHQPHSATCQRIWILRNTLVRTTNHADICLSSQKSVEFYEAWKFIAVFTTHLQLFLFWARRIQSNLFNALTIFLSTVMSSKWSVSSGFPTRYYMYFSSPPYLTVPIMKLLITHFSPVPRYHLHLASNIFLSTS